MTDRDVAPIQWTGWQVQQPPETPGTREWKADVVAAEQTMREGIDPTIPPRPWFLKQFGDPSIKPGDVVLLTVGDMTGMPARPVSAGRHLARDHWMKRLFLRGR